MPVTSTEPRPKSIAGTAALVTLATRLPVLLVGYAAVLTIGYAAGAPPYRLFTQELLNLPVRWDAGWYLRIANEGYDWTGNVSEQQPIVFFPAYPLLVRLIGIVFWKSAPHMFALVGVGISIVAFWLALSYLYRLARLDVPGDEASATIWLLAAYPFALFYGAVYTESLFLLGLVACIYHYRRREWYRAALWGMLVGLTRPNGCFLSIPLAFLAIEPWLPATLRRSTERHEDVDRRVLAPAMLTAAAPGIGMLLYSAYVGAISGSPFAWAAGHAAWGRAYEGMWTGVGNQIRFVQAVGASGYVQSLPYDLANAAGGLFVLALAVPVARRFGWGYGLVILVNMLPPLFRGGFLSVARFSSVLFPAFMYLAATIPPRHRLAWLASFMALQAFYAALFFTWRPMF